MLAIGLHTMRNAAPAAILANLALVACFLCNAAAAGEPVVVAQKLRIDGRTLNYDAETGRVAIRDTESGEPHGYMFYMAYRVASDRPRPLVFLWNGGPGSNSTLLHFEAFGPKRLQDGRLVDNAETLLTVADLVFVDPIGTGFSRPAKAEYASEFYNTLGDIASVTEFVRAWLLLHDATGRAIVLVGESWGAGRAGSVGYSLQTKRIPVSGLILISGGSGIAADVSPELRQALKAVGYAAAAYHHGRIPASAGTSMDKVLANTENWARTTYAPALAAADALSESDRDDIVAGLAKYTGLPVENIDRQTLRVTPRQFRTELLADEGKSLNVFDMRIDDSDGGNTRDVLEPYLRRTLGYRTDLAYLGLSGFDQGYAPGGKVPASVNNRWDYFTTEMSDEEKQAAIDEAVRTGAGPPRGGPPPPSTGEALAINPDLKVLVATGLYDSLGNCAGNREAEAKLEGAIAAAVEYRCYSGGHVMYRDADARMELSNDVKKLIAGAMH